MLGPLVTRLAESLTFYPMLALFVFVFAFVLITHRALSRTETEHLEALPLSKEDET